MSTMLKAVESVVPASLIRCNVPLTPYSTMKIGGKAQIMVTTDNAEILQKLLPLLSKESIPYFVVGGGSNIVFDDKGFEGVVIHLPLGSYSIEHRGKTTIVEFSGGYLSHLAAQKMISEGLSGLESFYGLPGTVGGAVVMNSKWPKDAFATGEAFIDGMYISEDGSCEMVKKTNLSFGYGYSALQKKAGILVSSRFLVIKDDPKVIQKKCESVMLYRYKTQPHGVHTAGCVFKNISESEQQLHNLPTRSAGYLIDQCGLKGYAVGGMKISTIHANFFVNEHKATSADFDALVSYVCKKVQHKFSIQLQPEVLRITS